MATPTATSRRRGRAAATPPVPPDFHVWMDRGGRIRTFNLRRMAAWLNVSPTHLLCVIHGTRTPGAALDAQMEQAGIWREVANAERRKNAR